MFFNKKKVIKNPDEMVLLYMENHSDKYIKEINKIDSNLLAKVLVQFDVKSVSNLMLKLSHTKAIEVFKLIETKKQAEIIKRLPSDYAALFMKETLIRV
ncbi:MAG: hypothetical protein PHV30_00475 [Candidatus Margulisbacteria bacterium]|nr:hypothetical protein [Candidatus Margulisiibacteriota bacterium]